MMVEVVVNFILGIIYHTKLITCLKKIRIFFLGVFFCSGLSFSVKSDFKDLLIIRSGFYDAVLDSKKATILGEKISKLKLKSSIIKVYEGATYAIMAKEKWNPFSAIRLLKMSNEIMDDAVQQSPTNIEIRFIRFAVQKNIPSFLGYSDNVDEDKKYIIQHIERFESKELPDEIKKYILSFIIEQGGYNDDEVKRIVQQFQK